MTGHLPDVWRVVAIRDRIPRFVEQTADELDRRTQRSFGYEWNEFSDWSWPTLTLRRQAA
jgi:hypothetical protein